MTTAAPSAIREQAHPVHRRWRVSGIVQGVGFRPWVWLTATRLGLTGEVGNDTQGVWIDASGSPEAMAAFREALPHAPAPAVVREVCEEIIRRITPEFSNGFRVAPSVLTECGSSALSPDLAPCPDCVRELFDPANRRYRYPFIACARCGPRYTVTTCLPYDRERTSLVDFPLCPQCSAEYANPADRRYHAEAIACPVCGPQVRACSPSGDMLASGDAAVQAAVSALANGQIVAVHGIGGFQLWVDATNASAVRRLRERKHRDAKPFAVMVAGLEDAQQLLDLTTEELSPLAGPAAPIVLVAKPDAAPIASEVAPGCAMLGLCFPASPLQGLICRDFGRPVVATSGNLSEEALCHDPGEAFERLGGIADLLLVHNRSILQPADDSVLRVVAGKPRMIRRARGHAPVPIELAMPVKAPGLAVGGQMKATLALVRGNQLVVSPHLGDMDTVSSRERHATTRAALESLLRLKPQWVACDMHPDYATTRFARELPLPRLEIQHHHAHLLAVLAEHRRRENEPVLGIIWDGTGFGTDGTIWGGEFLVGHGPSCRRVARLRPMPLPGGEAAVREPRRSAFAWLWQTLGPETAAQAAARLGVPAGPMAALCAGGLRTSSAGRLFDAVAALSGVCGVSRYEGHAAMLLETAAMGHPAAEAYPFSVRPADATAADVSLTGERRGWHLDYPILPDLDGWEYDTAPLAAAIWRDVRTETPVAEIAARFHQTLVAIIVDAAIRSGLHTIVLGGGCFQNAFLIEAASAALIDHGHEVLLPEQIPANDGGLAAGQAFAGCWLHPPA